MAHQTGAEQLIREELADLLSSPDYILPLMTDETANVGAADSYEVGTLSDLTYNSDGSSDMSADEPTVSTLTLLVDREPAILANIARRKMEQFLRGGNKWESAVAKAAQDTVKNKLDQELFDYFMTLADDQAQTWVNPACDALDADDLHSAWGYVMGQGGAIRDASQYLWVVDSFALSRMSQLPDWVAANQQIQSVPMGDGRVSVGAIVGAYLNSPVMLSSNLHGSIARGRYTVACTGVTISTNVATVTAASHGLVTGNKVTISGITTALTTAAAITVTGANTFTVALTAGDGAMADGTGTVQLEGCVNWFIRRDHFHFAMRSLQVDLHKAEKNTGWKLQVSPLWGRIGRSKYVSAIGTPYGSLT